MKRKEKIKLNFSRNWQLPGKERISTWLKPSPGLKTNFKDGITWLTGEDIAIFTTIDNFIEWTLLSSGTYENEINKLIRISLRPGDIALDIGANIGLQSIRMSQCVGNSGHVYSFEPLNYLQQKFNRNMALNLASNVTLFPYALSDIEGEADFKLDQNLWNQGTFSLADDGNGSETQRVLIKIADDIAEIQNLHSVNLIKIDVEGFEYQVLRGLKQVLTKHKPRIIFEYDSNYWGKTLQKIGDCYNYLRSLGYVIYQITSVGCELIKNRDSILSGNLFCIQEKTHEQR